MIYAAGFGTRMAPLTADRPKPMVEVAGKPLIDHALEQAAGINRIVVNTHYMAEKLNAHLADRPVQLIHEETLLGNGGGLRNALPLLGNDPVYTLNSDAVWAGAPALGQLAEAWDPARMDALLLLIDPSRAHGHKGRGDFILDADGRIKRGPGAIYSGTQIIKTDLLEAVDEDAFSTWTLE
jgi:MurNAc alpha-1-phosphate uridylyltransferase